MTHGKDRFGRIKAHFEKEAAVFDELFFKIMPRYEEMMRALVESLPFPRNDRFKIIDLGCGTGNLSRKILAAHPKASLTCIDLAEKMLAMARAKIGKSRQVSFRQGDIRDFDYSSKYDAIVSSMALHHVERKEKPHFYRKLHNALRRGGIFYAIDIFVSSSSHLQRLFLKQWKAYMKQQGLPAEKINEMMRRHRREDRAVCLADELGIMRRAGFVDVEVVLKHHNFALYGARIGKAGTGRKIAK